MKKFLLLTAVVAITATGFTLTAADDKDKAEKREHDKPRSLRDLPAKEHEKRETDVQRKRELLEQMKKRRAQMERDGKRDRAQDEEAVARKRAAMAKEMQERLRRSREHASRERDERQHDEAQKRSAQPSLLERARAAEQARHRGGEREHQGRESAEARAHRERDQAASRRREAEHHRAEAHQHAEHHRGRGHDDERKGHEPRRVSLEEAERNVHHLREASELLGAIGRTDLARQLGREANEIAEKLERHHRERGEQHEGPSTRELAGGLERLQDHVQHLTRKVQELEKRLNAKGGKH
ncbi:MAG: hypothetical protein ACPGVU_12150 [Limisphaerales bacterium]